MLPSCASALPDVGSARLMTTSKPAARSVLNCSSEGWPAVPSLSPIARKLYISVNEANGVVMHVASPNVPAHTSFFYRTRAIVWLTRREVNLWHFETAPANSTTERLKTPLPCGLRPCVLRDLPAKS